MKLDLHLCDTVSVRISVTLKTITFVFIPI